MTVHLVNETRVPAILQYQAKELVLPAFQTTAVNFDDCAAFEVSLRREGESEKPRNWDIYHFLIETTVSLANVGDGEIIRITREKMQVGPHAYFDKLFLLPTNGTVVSERYQIVAADKMKKTFVRSQRLHRFVTEPLSTALGAPRVFLLLFMGVGLSFIWGWKFAVVFSVAIYALFLAISWAIDRFWGRVEKKRFHLASEKEEFYGYFDEMFLHNFYANVLRKPYMGKVEVN